MVPYSNEATIEGNRPPLLLIKLNQLPILDFTEAPDEEERNLLVETIEEQKVATPKVIESPKEEDYSLPADDDDKDLKPERNL